MGQKVELNGTKSRIKWDKKFDLLFCMLYNVVNTIFKGGLYGNMCH